MKHILLALLLATGTAQAALRPRPTNPVNVPDFPATSWQPPWRGGFPIIK